MRETLDPIDTEAASDPGWWNKKYLSPAPVNEHASGALASLVRWVVALEERVRVLEGAVSYLTGEVK